MDLRDTKSLSSSIHQWTNECDWMRKRVRFPTSPCSSSLKSVHYTTFQSTMIISASWCRMNEYSYVMRAKESVLSSRYDNRLKFGNTDPCYFHINSTLVEAYDKSLTTGNRVKWIFLIRLLKNYLFSNKTSYHIRGTKNYVNQFNGDHWLWSFGKYVCSSLFDHTLWSVVNWVGLCEQMCRPRGATASLTNEEALVMHIHYSGYKLRRIGPIYQPIIPIAINNWKWVHYSRLWLVK